MEKERIHWWDFHRILIGEAPVTFLFEVFIRSLVIYIAAIIVMRWLGKRMNGQLSILELAIMIMMGATIGSPMQIPDRGIAQGLVILVVMLTLLRVVNLFAFNRESVEELLTGKLSILVKNGVLQTETLYKTRISKPQLYAALRSNNIFNLGRVKRMYLEPHGAFSIYEEKEAKPGLLLYPEMQDENLPLHQVAQDKLVCGNCGTVINSSNHEESCCNCQHTKWENAVI